MHHARQRGHEPVVFDAATGQWFVFAYEDVLAGLSDPRLTNDRMHRFADRAAPGALEAVRRHAPWLISPEGADYDWLRPVLHAGLRDAVGRPAERAIEAAAHALLDDLLARERFDLAADYAFAHSSAALGGFLGVDRGHGDRLMRWALDIVAFFNDAEVTTQTTVAMASSAAALVAYAHDLLGAERPGARGGFLALAAQTAARGGHDLDDAAVCDLALPFVTGQVGVAQLVVNCAWLLLGHEDQRARLAADPALLAGALGETLRYLPPASLAPRIALEPLTLGAHRIEPGQTVQLSLAAANRPGPLPRSRPLRHRAPPGRRPRVRARRAQLRRRRAGAHAGRHRAARAPGAGAPARPRRRARGRLEPPRRRGRAADAERAPYSSARRSSGSVTGMRQAKRSHT